ncbi:hypothetical protein HYALB_00010419 [Hymenoscyphus albidus]|uniref:Uncharacterized protein n=1 Tax=Hymenoscyphus albidus TaxID=595503 RepID=A0A9N9LZ91_9HELO|nr:hypothetical protein HYALB_00010419 [Hymenoscyphus albidus]
MADPINEHRLDGRGFGRRMGDFSGSSLTTLAAPLTCQLVMDTNRSPLQTIIGDIVRSDPTTMKSPEQVKHCY